MFFFSIHCLTALNKIDEASTLITQMIEQYPQNDDLLIIRDRLYYKDNTKVFIKILSFSFIRIFTKKKEHEFFEKILQ